MCEPLALSVARQPPRASRLLDLRLQRAPKGAHRKTSPKTSRGEPHRARAVETAAGLGRRTTSGPERLLLDRPEPCSPSRQMSHSLFACAASAPHPVACCERASPVKGRLLTSDYPAVAARELPREPLRARKMRLTNFCNRLPKRAPSGVSDSRAHLESLATFPVQSLPRPMTSVSSRVEPRLTAMLQLRRSSDTPEKRAEPKLWRQPG